MSSLGEKFNAFLDGPLLAAERVLELPLSILFIAGLLVVVGLAALSKQNRAKLAVRLSLALLFAILYRMDRRMAWVQREPADFRGQAADYSMAWTQTARFIGRQRQPRTAMGIDQGEWRLFPPMVDPAGG